MPTYYLDYDNGNDAADGSTFALGGLPAVGPWKTITAGPTAARIVPGDVIHIAKSPAPTLVCNATWNNRSKIVTLDAAQTLEIDDCDINWTGANGAACALIGVGTTAKEGLSCLKVTMPAVPAVATKYAYHALPGVTDFSAYQKISFWILPQNTYTPVAGNFKICLCSDALGAVIVDTFLINLSVPGNSYYWAPLTLTKVGGGNLGNNIQSIALYSDTIAPTGSKYIYYDHFIACTANGLNLQSLISKSALEQGGTESWHGIQSIVGTTVLLDDNTATKANAGQGYYGATENVPTYKRETIKTLPMGITSTANIQVIQDSGAAGQLISFKGGYNTATDLQDGETFWDGLNSMGLGTQLNEQSYIHIDGLCMYRYYSGHASTVLINVPVHCELDMHHSGNCLGGGCSWWADWSVVNVDFTHNGGGLAPTGQGSIWTCIASNCNNNGISSYMSDGIIVTVQYICNSVGSGIVSGTDSNTIFNVAHILYNTGSGISYTDAVNCIANLPDIQNCGARAIRYLYCHGCVLIAGTVANNVDYAVDFNTEAWDNIVMGMHSSGHAVAGVRVYPQSRNYLYDCQMDEALEIQTFDNATDGRVFSIKHDKNLNNNWIFTDYGSINMQAATRHNDLGYAWRFNITDAHRDSTYKLSMVIARVFAKANIINRFSAWMKKDHAANVSCQLRIPGGIYPGIAAEITSVKAANTDWERVSIEFTTTEDFAINIYAETWYVAGNSACYVQMEDECSHLLDVVGILHGRSIKEKCNLLRSGFRVTDNPIAFIDGVLN